MRTNRIPHRGLLVTLLILGAACTYDPWSDEDAWDETELTRDVAEWFPADYSLKPDLGKLKRHFGLFGTRPNLWDLHAPYGALSLAQQKHGWLAMKILEAAKEPVEIDEVSGTLTFRGGARTLWLRDKTRLELPATRSRWGLPQELGLVSISEDGWLRAAIDEEMSSPIEREHLANFAGTWVSRHGGGGRPEAEALEGRTAAVARISAQGLALDGRPVTSLAGEVGEDPVVLAPDPSACYGDRSRAPGPRPTARLCAGLRQ